MEVESLQSAYEVREPHRRTCCILEFMSDTIEYNSGASENLQY